MTIRECQMVWIQIRTFIVLVLIWLQTVCKGYQQTTKVAASKESVINSTFCIAGGEGSIFPQQEGTSSVVARGKYAKNKTLPCPVCGKVFTCNSYLAVHKRIHTGDKPFECGICGRRFTQKSNLNSHQVTHYKDSIF